MHWDEELTRLATRKAALQRSIARSRAQCVEAAARIARPVDRFDRIAAIWREFSPSIKFGAVPLGLLVARLALPRRGILGALVRWGPIAFAAARAIGSMTNSRPHRRALAPEFSRTGPDPLKQRST